jgi:hypothetical protein
MRRHLVLTLLAAMLLGAFAPRSARAVDLRPEAFDVFLETDDVSAADVAEGCAGGTQDRRLLRYALRTRNLGPGDLALGNPQCPDCLSNPGAACANPNFVCGTAHGHVHFEGFARSELLDGNGNVVAGGAKSGFCVLDSECHVFRYSCNNQGLTAGCADVYSAGLPCQYIDLTDADVPPGTYTLRVTSDPDNRIAETNESNNVATIQVEIGSTGPTPTTTPAPLCASLPRTNCHTSPRSLLELRGSPDPRKQRLSWRWLKGDTARPAFGNPEAVTRYAFCLYDEAAGTPKRTMSIAVPEAGTCGRRACWSQIGERGFRYSDRLALTEGVHQIAVVSGEGRARMVVQGKGVQLPIPALPIEPYIALRAQLVNSENECWESLYTPPATSNTATRFKDSTAE